MGEYKAILKDFFYKTGTAGILDKMIFGMSWLKNKRKNTLYKRANKNISIPPDYYLYETYRLDYAEYIQDGMLTGKEIVECAGKYLIGNPEKVLEWGCGVSRIIRHLHDFYPSTTGVYGCDINSGMISWNQRNIRDVAFDVINFEPPTRYNAGQFDMIYGMSVFTHIVVEQQKGWLREMHRILKPEGVFLFTTHGYNYLEKMLGHERKQLEETGGFTKSYYKKGHRMMSSYNLPEKFGQLVKEDFDVLEFWDGKEFPSKMGGQDLWIVRKRS
jgi:ubiquinone/menaquinone biosynthesis C-methylase UbiE